MDNSLLSVIGSSRSVLSILYDGDSKDFLFSTLDRLLIISPIDYKNEIIDDELFTYNRRSIKITTIISKDQVGLMLLIWITILQIQIYLIIILLIILVE